MKEDKSKLQLIGEIAEANNKNLELIEEIERLNKQVHIMERYFKLIIDLGFDYDGFNNVKDLKKLIDELVRYASLGREYNTTECIYVSDNEKYNILLEELKEGK